MKTIETKRLILRPWCENDAETLYEYAKDLRVGPPAGFPPHTSVENSREVIKTILSDDGNLAVTLKGDDRPIGSIGLKKTLVPGHEGETEIGYWIGVPFWGQGLIPEVVFGLLHYAFEELGLPRVWCGHYEGNDKSRRVIEKCGFHFELKLEKEVPLLGEKRMEYYYYVTKEDF